MLNPPINELLSIVDSRYSLVIAASKRARQIIEGEKVLVDTNLIKPVSIATDELYQGKVFTKPTEEEEDKGLVQD